MVRERTGGGIRQVGVPAAAGRYALDHHVDRLAEDHARADRGAGTRKTGTGLVEQGSSGRFQTALNGVQRA